MQGNLEKESGDAGSIKIIQSTPQGIIVEIISRRSGINQKIERFVVQGKNKKTP